MTAQRTPKRPCPHEMCFECKHWEPCYLDWGDCFWIGEAVPGDLYQLTYAYADCFFKNSAFNPKVDI